MPNKTYGTVRKDRLPKLPTPELIAEYDVAISSYDGRFTNSSPRQKRINYICDLLLDRADNGDDAAQEWLDAAK